MFVQGLQAAYNALVKSIAYEDMTPAPGTRRPSTDPPAALRDSANLSQNTGKKVRLEVYKDAAALRNRAEWKYQMQPEHWSC